MNKKHMGSKFDDFLREEQLLNAVETAAVKRVIAFQIQREMKRSKITKTAMAGPEDQPCRTWAVIRPQ